MLEPKERKLPPQDSPRRGPEQPFSPERFKEPALAEEETGREPETESFPSPPSPEAFAQEPSEVKPHLPKTAAEFVGLKPSREEIAAKIRTASRRGEGQFSHAEGAAALEEQVEKYFRTKT